MVFLWGELPNQPDSSRVVVRSARHTPRCPFWTHANNPMEVAGGELLARIYLIFAGVCVAVEAFLGVAARGAVRALDQGA